MRAGGGFRLELIEDSPGLIVFSVEGKDAKSAFAGEVGSIRVHQVPENERRGRVHTSTITVAVLPDVGTTALSVRESEISYRAFNNSKAGGQHANRHLSCIEARHIPTGVTATSTEARSQNENKAIARSVLLARLSERRSRDAAQRANAKRRDAGDGSRGSYRRSVRFQDGVVVDHASGWEIPLRDYLKGNW